MRYTSVYICISYLFLTHIYNCVLYVFLPPHFTQSGPQDLGHKCFDLTKISGYAIVFGLAEIYPSSVGETTTADQPQHVAKSEGMRVN